MWLIGGGTSPARGMACYSQIHACKLNMSSHCTWWSRNWQSQSLLHQDSITNRPSNNRFFVMSTSREIDADWKDVHEDSVPYANGCQPSPRLLPYANWAWQPSWSLRSPSLAPDLSRETPGMAHYHSWGPSGHQRPSGGYLQQIMEDTVQRTIQTALPAHPDRLIRSGPAQEEPPQASKSSSCTTTAGSSGGMTLTCTSASSCVPTTPSSAASSPSSKRPILSVEGSLLGELLRVVSPDHLYLYILARLFWSNYMRVGLPYG